MKWQRLEREGHWKPHGKAACNLPYSQRRRWEAASHSLLTLQYLGGSRLAARIGRVNGSWEQWEEHMGKGRLSSRGDGIRRLAVSKCPPLSLLGSWDHEYSSLLSLRSF